jgi:hypothetical protein
MARPSRTCAFLEDEGRAALLVDADGVHRFRKRMPGLARASR